MRDGGSRGSGAGVARSPSPIGWWGWALTLVATTVVCWRPWGFDAFLPPKEVAWQLGAVLSVAALLATGRVGEAGRVGPLALLLPLGLVSMAITGPQVIGFKMVCNVCLAVIWVALMAGTVSPFQTRRLLQVVAGVAVGQALVGWLQAGHALWGWSWPRPGSWLTPVWTDAWARPVVPLVKDRVLGLLGVPAHLAALLALSLPACWSLARGWREGAVMVCGGLLLVLGNVGGFLAVAVGLTYLCWRRAPAWRLPWLGGLALLGLVSLWGVSWETGRRELVWAQVVALVGEHPWIGWGFGTFQQSLQLWTTPPGGVERELWVHPHNEYLAWAFATGALGIVVACLIAGWTVMRMTYIRAVGCASHLPIESDIAVAGLLAGATNALVNYPAHVAPLAMLGLTYGMIVLVWSRAGEDASRRAYAVRLTRTMEVGCAV